MAPERHEKKSTKEHLEKGYRGWGDEWELEGSKTSATEEETLEGLNRWPVLQPEAMGKSEL